MIRYLKKLWQEARRRDRRRRHRSAGFTMLEIMIVIAIIAALGAGVGVVGVPELQEGAGEDRQAARHGGHVGRHPVHDRQQHLPAQHGRPHRPEVRRRSRAPRIRGARTSPCAARARRIRRAPTSARRGPTRRTAPPTTSSPGSSAGRERSVQRDSAEMTAIDHRPTTAVDDAGVHPHRDHGRARDRRAMMVAGVVKGFRSLRKADLRESATHLSGADALPVRSRVDDGKDPPHRHRHGDRMYWAEVSDDRFYIPREETGAAARARGQGGGGGRGGGEEARARRAEAESGKGVRRQFQLRSVEAGGRPTSGPSAPASRRSRTWRSSRSKLKKNVKVRSVYTPRVHRCR